jgi:hypothetical protein
MLNRLMYEYHDRQANYYYDLRVELQLSYKISRMINTDKLNKYIDKELHHSRKKDYYINKILKKD